MRDQCVPLDISPGELHASYNGPKPLDAGLYAAYVALDGYVVDYRGHRFFVEEE